MWLWVVGRGRGRGREDEEEGLGRASLRRAPAVPLASKENSLVWRERVVVSFWLE